MLKFFLVAVAAGGLFLLTPAGDQFKASALSIVNPAAVERQSLANLRQHLDTMNKTVNQPAFQALTSAEKTKELKTMISQADKMLTKAEEVAQKSDVGATVSAITKTILPKSWTSPPVCPSP
jgi:hypothetical protein